MQVAKAGPNLLPFGPPPWRRLACLCWCFFAIVARNLFSYSIDIVEEYSGYLLVASFFLSLAALPSPPEAFHRVQIFSPLEIVAEPCCPGFTPSCWCLR